LNPIYFDLGQYNIRTDAAVEFASIGGVERISDNED